VKKTSWTPAQTLGLPLKGSIAPGFDADLCIVDSGAYRITTTVASGQVVFDGRTVSRMPVTHLSHKDSPHRRGDLPVDIGSSGLFTGAGRR
jgi:dihydroorotase-like cyclic amidohydrolase